MSTSPATQSRERILDTFHNISGMNIEDCIQYLNLYHWNLEEIVEDFYNKKDFKKHSVEKKERQQIPIQHSHSTSFTPQNNRQQPAVKDDDRYVAELLARYGDADESARRQWREAQQNSRSEQLPPQSSKGNIKTESIVHEKQKYLRCGVHSLNNLFQVPNLFTHEYLDSIASGFDKRTVNNDYSTTWVGDYDLRVLIEAITRRGHPVRQINYFTGEPLQNLPWDTYFGLLMNINGAHWFTIKNINGLYYNLDSTFSRPSQIGRKDALVAYLFSLIQKFKNIYIFSVLQETHRSNRS